VLLRAPCLACSWLWAFHSPPLTCVCVLRGVGSVPGRACRACSSLRRRSQLPRLYSVLFVCLPCLRVVPPSLLHRWLLLSPRSSLLCISVSPRGVRLHALLWRLSPRRRVSPRLLPPSLYSVAVRWLFALVPCSCHPLLGCPVEWVGSTPRSRGRLCWLWLSRRASFVCLLPLGAPLSGSSISRTAARLPPCADACLLFNFSIAVCAFLSPPPPPPPLSFPLRSPLSSPPPPLSPPPRSPSLTPSSLPLPPPSFETQTHRSTIRRTVRDTYCRGNRAGRDAVKDRSGFEFNICFCDLSCASAQSPENCSVTAVKMCGHCCLCYEVCVICYVFPCTSLPRRHLLKIPPPHLRGSRQLVG
jgi:hypothetical protein